MQNILRFLLVMLTAVPAVFGQVRKIEAIDFVNDSKTIPIRVSASSAELNSLALQAFSTHGRYRLLASGHAYEIKFTLVTATQVRVDITKGSAGTPFASAVATGTNERHALLRAADIAVEKTNGLGLKGYFTAQVAVIGERTGKKEIYTADLFFRDVKQITRDNALALMPRWSPDGSKIIYTSFFRSGFPDIFVIDLATQRRDTFVSFKGTNQGARYSPNGQQVAMVLSGEGTPEIYVASAQGRNVTRKTRSDAVKSSPSFSPDGTRLVFASEPGPQIYIIPVAGGVAQRVTSGISGYCAEPDWSHADPNKIAFTFRVGRNYQIGVLDLSKRTSVQASKALFDGVEPSWLPDGRHLVYTARSGRESRICILDTESGKSTPISPTSFGSTMQASVWSR